MKIPAPPEPFLVHPYAMNRPFLGRKTTLGMLDEWAGKGRLMILEAVGGMGKSALAWHWLHNHVPKIPGVNGIIWWSFYESAATARNFLRHACAYATGGDLEDYIGMDTDKVLDLFEKAIEGKRYLFILDGMERILTAYHRLDAPRLQDNIAENEDPKEYRRLCSFVDPRDVQLFQRLITKTASQLLVTTRLTPTEFLENQKIAKASIRHSLEGLALPEALELLRNIGITNDTSALLPVISNLQGHSLLLQVVGATVAASPRYRGDLAAWHEEIGNDLTRGGMIEYALSELREKPANLLSRIAAFRYPIPVEAVLTVSDYYSYSIQPPEEKPDPNLLEYRDKLESPDYNSGFLDMVEAEVLKERNWKIYEALKIHYGQLDEVRENRKDFYRDLSLLRERGLLMYDEKKDIVDLHPVIRSYAFENLMDKERVKTFDRIRDYFGGIPETRSENPSSVSDLTREIEIYYALINAMRHEEALRFYRDHFSSLLYRMGAYPTIVEMVSPFFSEGYEGMPVFPDYKDRSFLIVEMSNALDLLHYTDEAKHLRRLQVDLDLEHENIDHLSFSLANFSISLRFEEKLFAAIEAATLSLDAANAYDDMWNKKHSLLILIGLRNDTGDIEEARRLESMLVQMVLNKDNHAELAREHLNQIMFLDLDTDASLRILYSLAEEIDKKWDKIAVLQIHGMIELNRGNLSRAESLFSDTLLMSREMGTGTEVCRGALSQIYAAQGRVDEARLFINELVEEDPAIFVCHFLSEAFLHLGEREKAVEYAIKSYTETWAEGPPYAWEMALKTSRNLLAKLGVPEPTLPVRHTPLSDELPNLNKIREFIRWNEEANDYELYMRDFYQKDLTPLIPREELLALKRDGEAPSFRYLTKAMHVFREFFPIRGTNHNLKLIGDIRLNEDGLLQEFLIIDLENDQVTNNYSFDLTILPFEFLNDDRLETYFRMLARHFQEILSDVMVENLDLRLFESLPQPFRHPLDDTAPCSEEQMLATLLSPPTMSPLPEFDEFVEAVERDQARHDPEIETLTGQIKANPENLDLYKNLAELLMDRGDPWGELIDLQLEESKRGETNPVPGRAAKALMRKGKKHFLKNLHTYGFRQKIRWQNGFIDSLWFDTENNYEYDYFEDKENENSEIINENALNKIKTYEKYFQLLFDYVIRSKPAALLKQLRLASRTYQDLEPFLHILLNHPPPMLEKLILGEENHPLISSYKIGPLYGLDSAFPRLAHLTICGRQIETGSWNWPGLRSLTIRTDDPVASTLRALTESRLTGLQSLEIRIEENHTFCFCGHSFLKPLLDADLFPSLERLALRSVMTDDLAEALAHSSLLPRLRELDLSEGTLTDRGALALLNVKERMERLELLIVAENRLTMKMAHSLKELAPAVRSAPQNDPEEGQNESTPS